MSSRPVTPTTSSAIETGVHWLLAGATAAGVHYLYLNRPVAYLRLISEDWHGEYATALSFLVLSLCFCALAWRAKGICRWIWWAIAAGGFFVGMEELSWGQRILGISTPGPLREANLQGEITLHNLVFLPQLHEIAGFLILAWVLVSFTRLSRLPKHFGVPLFSLPIVPWFLLTADQFLRYPFVKSDELGEFYLGCGVALLGVYSWIQYRNKSSDARPRLSRVGPRLLLTVATLLALALGAEALTHLYNGGLGFRLRTAAVRDYPNRELYAQSDRIFDYMYEHPEYLESTTRIEHARILLQRNLGDRAREVLLAALEARPPGESQAAEETAEALRTEGEILLLLDRKDEAESLLAQSISVDENDLGQSESDSDSDSVELLWSLARTEHIRGDFKRSRQRYDEALTASGSAKLLRKIRIWGKSVGWEE